MLSCRRVRQCRRVGLQWRSSSSQAGEPSTSTPPTLPHSTGPRHPRLDYVLGRRSCLLRVVQDARGLYSPLDAYAIIRAIERRFGRVAEYRFYRDAESNRLQYLGHFSFFDPAAYERVPRSAPTVLRVAVPAAPPGSGGVGLADLEKAGVLVSKDWRDNDLTEEVRAHFEAPELKDGERVIQFHVDHWDGRFQKHHMPPPTYVARFNQAFTANFVRWGGFAPMKPDGARVTRGDVLWGSTKVDHPAMRFALQLWGSPTNPFGVERMPDNRSSSIQPEDKTAEEKPLSRREQSIERRSRHRSERRRRGRRRHRRNRPKQMRNRP
ncbi:hypothetical protein B0H11DRAFT_613085 [Mycena galericulata]|nr:hypothetical protein B0H11DRAFT_613085 [Mycena galericulata]